MNPFALPVSPPGPRRRLRVALAYNPVSGGFSARRLRRLRDALEHAGHQVRCQPACDFTMNDPAGAVDVICAFGGDGTARDLVMQNWGAAGRATYCVYPAGTINLIAREAHYPADIASFVGMIGQDAEAGRHYVGRIGAQVFLCCASVGPDAEAVARVSPALKRRIGRLAYVVAMAGLLWHWPRHRFAITVDGARHEAEAVFICKGRYYAGPFVLDDRASLADDSFRVLTLPRARRRDFARLALGAVLGGMGSDPAWLRLSGRCVTIAGPAGRPVQTDGDVLETTPATITIAAEPLRFL